MRKLSVWVCMVAFCSLAAAAVAEEAEPSLGTVVVTATRTSEPLASVTNSISVVTDQDIAARQSTTVTDSLRDVPGVDIVQAGSLGNNTSVFIRGANSDQTLILMDGVEVNSPTLGGFNFGNITTDDVGRIEVLRGAGGTLYGSEAVGGVVNILTKPGEGAPHLTLSSAGGNIGTASELGALSGRSGIVAYTASLGYLTTGGFRPLNDDFSNLTSAARVDVTPIEHGTLRGIWRSAHSSLGLANNDISDGLGPFVDPDARQRDEFYLGKVEWEHTVLDRLTYRIAGAYTRTVNVFADRADAQEQASPNFPGNQFFLTSSRIPNEITSGETQVSYAEGTIARSTAGFEFKEKSGAVKEVNLDGSIERFAHSRSTYAGYAQQQLFLFQDRLVGVGGFRVDADQDFGREVSASWSVGYLEHWNADGRWDTHLKGGYAEGFRAPTFNELFFPGSGNPNLTAETSSEYDGGLEQHLGFRSLAVQGTFFTRRTGNLIDFVPIAQCPGAAMTPGAFFVPCNLGRTDVRGAESEVRLGPWYGVLLQGTYTYLDFDVLGGAKLLRRPHNRMGTSLTYDAADLAVPGDRFTANTNVIFVGARTDFDPLTFNANATNPAYARTDVAVRYDLPLRGSTTRRLGCFARVQNLFDRSYQEALGFRAPPLNVLAGSEVTF